MRKAVLLMQDYKKNLFFENMSAVVINTWKRICLEASSLAFIICKFLSDPWKISTSNKEQLSRISVTQKSKLPGLISSIDGDFLSSMR